MGEGEPRYIQCHSSAGFSKLVQCESRLSMISVALGTLNETTKIVVILTNKDCGYTYKQRLWLYLQTKI